jgi:hypothetical protein
LRSQKSLPPPGNQDDEDDVGNIRIGSDYQASIPARDFVYPHFESSEDNGDVLWDPSLAQAATEFGADVDGYLEQASEMNAKFLLMEALHKKQYSTKNARTEFMQLCRKQGDFSVELNFDEKALAHKMFLEQVGRGKQKDFTAISKAVGRKKDALLVNYYRWKSEGRAYAAAKKGREPEVCSVCDDGGLLLVCDSCRNAFHMECLTPALSECPEGNWSCDRCRDLSPSPGKSKRLAMTPLAKSPRKSIPRKSIPSPARFISPARNRSTEPNSAPSRSSLLISGNRKKPPTRSASERRDDRKRELAYVHKELGSPKRGGSSKRRDAAAKKTRNNDWNYTSPSIANADEDGACHSSSPPSTGSSTDLPKSKKAASIPMNKSSSSPDTSSSFHESDTEVSDDDFVDAELLQEERVSHIPKRQNTGGADPSTAHNGTSSNSGPTSAQGLPDNIQDYIDALRGVSNGPASQGPTRGGLDLTATHNGSSNNIGLTPAQALALLAARYPEGNAIGTNRPGLNGLLGFAASSGPASQAATNQGGTDFNNFGGFAFSSGPASQASTNQGGSGLNFFHNRISDNVRYASAQTSLGNGNAYFAELAAALNGPMSQGAFQSETGLNAHSSSNIGSTLAQALASRTTGYSGGLGFTSGSSTGSSHVAGPVSQGLNRGGTGFDAFQNGISNNSGYSVGQSSLRNGNADAMELQMLLTRAQDDADAVELQVLLRAHRARFLPFWDVWNLLPFIIR